MNAVTPYRPLSITEWAECFATASHAQTVVLSHPSDAQVCAQQPGPWANRPLVSIDPAAVNTIIQLSVGDLMASVETGISVGDFQRQLFAHGVWWPHLYPAHLLLLDLFQSGLAGLGQWSHHTLKHSVLGTTLLSPHGQQIQSGGRVMKNVSGYNAHPFLVGSYGQFGALASVNLRLAVAPRTLTIAQWTLPSWEALSFEGSPILLWALPEAGQGIIWHGVWVEDAPVLPSEASVETLPFSPGALEQAMTPVLKALPPWWTSSDNYAIGQLTLSRQRFTTEWSHWASWIQANAPEGTVGVDIVQHRMVFALPASTPESVATVLQLSNALAEKLRPQTPITWTLTDGTFRWLSLSPEATLALWQASPPQPDPMTLALKQTFDPQYTCFDRRMIGWAPEKVTVL